MAEMEDVTLDGKPLHSLRVTDLKAALEQRGLPKSGQKSALIKRLKGALMLENLQKHSTPHSGFQPNSQIGEEMSQNSFIKQYLEKQQELLRQRLEREAREAAEIEEPQTEGSAESEDETIHMEQTASCPLNLPPIPESPESTAGRDLQSRYPSEISQESGIFEDGWRWGISFRTKRGSIISPSSFLIVSLSLSLSLRIKRIPRKRSQEVMTAVPVQLISVRHLLELEKIEKVLGGGGLHSSVEQDEEDEEDQEEDAEPVIGQEKPFPKEKSSSLPIVIERRIRSSSLRKKDTTAAWSPKMAEHLPPPAQEEESPRAAPHPEKVLQKLPRTKTSKPVEKSTPKLDAKEKLPSPKAAAVEKPSVSKAEIEKSSRSETKAMEKLPSPGLEGLEKKTIDKSTPKTAEKSTKPDAKVMEKPSAVKEEAEKLSRPDTKAIEKSLSPKAEVEKSPRPDSKVTEKPSTQKEEVQKSPKPDSKETEKPSTQKEDIEKSPRPDSKAIEKLSTQKLDSKAIEKSSTPKEFEKSPRPDAKVVEKSLESKPAAKEKPSEPKKPKTEEHSHSRSPVSAERREVSQSPRRGYRSSRSSSSSSRSSRGKRSSSSSSTSCSSSSSSSRSSSRSSRSRSRSRSRGRSRSASSGRRVAPPSLSHEGKDVAMETESRPESEPADPSPDPIEDRSGENARSEDENSAFKIFSYRKCSAASKPAPVAIADSDGGQPTRKRRWGSSTVAAQKKPSISITTESLKSLIPEIKPVAGQEAVVDLHADDARISEDESERNGDDGSHDKGLQIRRTVTQVVPAEGQENGQEEEKEEEEEEPEQKEPQEVCMETSEPPSGEHEVKKVGNGKPGSASLAVTLGDTLVRRSISQQKSGVSITIDDPVRTAQQPSPPRGKVTTIVHICNLVRPFTLGQLKELLNRTGTLIEETFWIDKIKSHCFATYSSVEEAVATRNALHGVKWPQSNPKLLTVDFAEQEQLDFHRGLLPEKPSEQKPPEEVLHPDHREQERAVQDQWAERELEMQRRERTRSEREWDRGKVREYKHEEGRRSRSRSRDRRRKERAKSKEKKSEKKEKAQEEPPAKLLDDLFRKTKAAPCIYWLPLTDEQIVQKVAERAERAKEREKRRKEQEEEERKREEERKERVKEREKEREKETERNREREREQRRDHSRGRDRERDRSRERRDAKRHTRSRSRSTPVRERGG
uniref:SAP domain-containing protein n=1 Tax=Latimeria chalumnae TaxID=7897 RepID=H3B6Z4_LATCH